MQELECLLKKEDSLTSSSTLSSSLFMSAESSSKIESPQKDSSATSGGETSTASIPSHQSSSSTPLDTSMSLDTSPPHSAASASVSLTVNSDTSSPSGNKDEELIAGLRAMSERFGSDCDERRAVSSYQFEQLSSQLLPPPMRFLLWMMAQPDTFYDRQHSDPAAAAAAARSLQTSASGERIMVDAQKSTTYPVRIFLPFILLYFFFNIERTTIIIRPMRSGL